MADPDFVTVRRSTTLPFGVLAGDLDTSETTGYDLDMMRSLTQEGLTHPLVVEPIAGGRFRVLDGHKRLAAIQILVRVNKPIYDVIRCVMRPASRMFAMLRCRVQTAAEANQKPATNGSKPPAQGLAPDAERTASMMTPTSAIAP